MIVTIDTGATKTLISSFDRKGKRGESYKFPTPQDAKDYTRQLREIIREHYGHLEVDAIALALPGTMVNGVAVWCKNLKWENYEAKTLLKDMLPGVPLLIENDANLAGLSEARALNPVPATALYITVSTGIGSGIITNGSIDPSFSTSEAGLALVEYDGKVRQWETFASGRAIVEVYKKRGEDITSKRVWRQIADRISRGFLAVIPILQPDIIILGGSVGTHYDKFQAELKGLLREQLPPHIPLPKIVQAEHPEEAVIYGCYYYAKDYLSSKKPRT